MARRASYRSDNLRSAIAEEAARLMAEHGIQDFLAAKKKAAERLQVFDRALLPKNAEIEAALMSRQRLFGGTQHARSLQQQRRTALEAMRLLAGFEPRLVGPVLHGSATEHADIQLHVFSDSPEAVYTHLMDRRYDYEVFERRVRMSAERQVVVPTVRFDINDGLVEAFVFQRDGIRQAPVSPVDGRPMRRADHREVLKLLADAIDDEAADEPTENDPEP
jgi:hypothetical protein